MNDNLYADKLHPSSWLDDLSTIHLQSFLFGIAKRAKKRNPVDLGKPPTCSVGFNSP